MNRVDIYLSSVVQFLEKIYRERKERASRKKTGNTHDRKPYRHINLQIHIKKEKKCRDYTSEEYDKNYKQVDVFFHRIW